MALLGQLRRDTLANWRVNNPVLADGEFALIASDSLYPKKYNYWVCGDGTTAFVDLPMGALADSVGITGITDQEGNSSSLAASQKFVTEKMVEVGEKIDDFEKIVSPVIDSYTEEEQINISELAFRNFTIRTDGTYGSNINYKHSLVETVPGRTISVTAGEYFTRFCFVKSEAGSTSNGAIDLCVGKSVVEIPSGTTMEFIAPSDAVAFLIYRGIDPYNNSPSNVTSLNAIVPIDNLITKKVSAPLSANQGVELGARSKTIMLSGNDNEIVISNRIPILKDHTYNLYLSDSEIDMSNVTYTSASYTILRVQNYSLQFDGEEQERFVDVTANDRTLREVYTFTPTVNGWLVIRARFNSGERQIFDLVDKTGVMDTNAIVDKSGFNYLDDSVKGITAAEVLSANVLPELLNNLEVDEVQVFDSAYLSRFQANFSITKDTQKYGSSTSYLHCIIDLSYADYIYCKSTSYGISIAFTDTFEFGTSNGNIGGLIGSVIYLGTGEFVIKKPEGAIICLFYCQGSNYSTAEVRVFNKLPKNASEVKKILCNGPEFWNHGYAFKGALMRYFPQYSYKIETGEQEGTSRSSQGIWYSFPQKYTSWTDEINTKTGQHGMCASLNIDFIPAPSYATPIPENSPWYIFQGITSATYTPREEDFIITEMVGKNVAERINDISKQNAYRNVKWEDVPVVSSDARVGYVESAIGNIVSSSYHYEIPIPEGANVLCIISDRRSSQSFYFVEELPDFSVSGAYGKFISNPINYSNLKSAGNNVAIQPVYEIPAGATYVCINCSSNRYIPQRIAFGFKKDLLDITSEDGDSTTFSSVKNDFRAKEIQEAALVGLTLLNPELDESNYEKPRYLQEKNVILKTEQLSKLKWTPKSSFYGKTITNTHLYEQGVQQTGIPYSNNYNDYKYIGQTVSIHTFMTAINNPYSLIYTERVSTSNSQSIWGRTYYGPNGNAYYGSVCCAFTTYVDGYDGYIGNGPYKYFSTNFGVTRVVTKPGQFDINLLRIGDVLNNDSHSIVITGLRRDNNGDIDQIRISECTGSYAHGGARIRTVSPSYFASLLWSYSNDPYAIYRYNNFYRNTKYIPSEYVAAGDETTDPTEVVYNNDICTIYGDRATIAEGYQMVINYDLDGEHSGWTGIEVYKDEVLVNTYILSNIDQSTLPEGQRNHALDLGNQLTEGMYKARMTDGTNYSDYVYWEIISNNVSVEKIDTGTYKVKNNTGKDLVECVIGTYKQDEKLGMSRASLIQPLTQEDINNDEFTLYLKDILAIRNLNMQTPRVFKLVVRGNYSCCATAVIKLPDVEYNESGEDDDPDND